MFKLNNNDTIMFLNLPESGMGYQVIDTKRYGLVYVFNAELVLTKKEIENLPEFLEEFPEFSENIPKFNGISHETLLQEAKELPIGFNFIEKFNPLMTPEGLVKITTNNTLAPAPQLSCTTDASDGFIRFSAYANDKRVNPDGSVVENTYATTVSDARFAVSGLAVAGRYALPNPSPAIYVYTIVPEVQEIVPNGKVCYLAGTVRPAYYQSGGGVEVLFYEGAKAGSAFKRPYKIPEK